MMEAIFPERRYDTIFHSTMILNFTQLKVIYPERHFPYTYESLGTDVNAAAARRIQVRSRVKLSMRMMGNGY